MTDRTERVILTADTSSFTTSMARAAAQTIALKKGLDGLDGAQTDVGKSAPAAERGVDGIGKSSTRASKEVDQFSGRLALLRDTAITMGPALVPLGAAAIGTLPALAAGFGAVAGGVGVTVLAMQGLGDATKALNEASLNPTTENLAAARDELAKIGPVAADFAIYLQRIKPQLLDIQNIARAGFLPGLEAGIENILSRGPQVEAIVGDLSRAVGDLITEAGAGIDGPAFDGFFEYLEREAGPILMSVGRSIGNVATGIANMLVGFAPVTSDFTGGLERMTRSFAQWSKGLEDNAGFQQFVSYIRESGPQAIALLGGLVKAVAGLAQAAAPLGSTLLPVLTQLVEAFAAVASSPIGGPLLTAAAAMTVVSRATSAAEIAMTRFGDSSTKAGTALATSLKAGAAIAGITLVSQGVTELNSALDELNLDRNLQALSLGAPVEDLDNMALAIERVSSGLRAGQEPLLELTSGFGLLGDTTLDGAQDGVKQLDQSLAQMVESGRADQAAAAFERLMAAAVDRGVDVDEARSQFTAYATALDNVAASAPPAADASKGLANAWRSTAAAARQEAQAIRDSVDAMLEKKNATLSAFGAETNYRQALKAARAQADKNNAGIRGDSAAVLANRAAIEQLAGAWNGQSAAVRNNIGRFKEARANFIQTAQAMGVPKQAAIELAQELLAIPKSRVTEVRAETRAALTAIQGIKSQLDSIPRSIRTDYYVNQVNSISRRANVPLPGEYAEGGLIRGPGTTTSDSIPAWLSDREYVVNAAAVDHYGVDFMDRVNARRLASGGLATRDDYALASCEAVPNRRLRFTFPAELTAEVPA